MYIYHIVLPDVWERVRGGSTYAAESLETEGFIHCSYDHQIEEVIGRYYADATAIVVLKIDVSRLKSKLVSEPSTGGDNYPHIYGPINLDAVEDVREHTVKSEAAV